MKINEQIIISIVVFITLPIFSAKAQNMAIKNVSLQPNDKTAILQCRLDNNGDTCALIRIKTNNLEGLEFTNRNQYISVNYSDGTYNVYVPTITRKLDISHKDFISVQLDLADYGIRRIRKGRTYLVVLEATRMSDLTSSVIFKVAPKWSQVIFDENNYSPTENGILEISAPAGRHNYTIHSDNYHSQNGSFSIGKNQVKTITVRLQPITYQIKVNCNVPTARVFIDNIDYGSIGMINLPQGRHKLRIQAKGYLDTERDVIINSTTKDLYYNLKKNSKEKHIHAVPVTIYAPLSSCIYKNNKKLEGWSNGATIMFMPGKYLLSDDRGDTYKIVVKDKPLEVKM